MANFVCICSAAILGSSLEVGPSFQRQLLGACAGPPGVDTAAAGEELRFGDRLQRFKLGEGGEAAARILMHISQP